MKKSLIALLLAVAMLLSVVPAMADISAALPWEGDTITYHCVGADMLTENPETQTYQEYLKIIGNVDLQWELVPTSDVATKNNLYFNSGDIPDLMWTSGNTSVIQEYGDMGYWLDLSKYMEEYMPNFAWWYANKPHMQVLVQEDGAIYCAVDVDPYDYVCETWFYNKTALDAIGYTEPPKTWDEMLEQMKAYKAYNPDGYGFITYAWGVGHWMYAFGLLSDWETSTWYYNEEAETWDNAIVNPESGYKDLVEIMNILYTEGLIHPEFDAIASDTVDQICLDGNWLFTYRYSGGFVKENFGEAPAADNSLLPFEIGTFTTPALTEGAQRYGTITVSSNNLGGWAYFAGAEVEHPEVMAGLMDLCISEELTDLAAWGIKGISYDIDADGVKYYLDDYATNTEKQEALGMTGILNFTHLGRMVHNSTWMPDFAKNQSKVDKDAIDLLTDELRSGELAHKLETRKTPTFTVEEKDTVSASTTPMSTYLSENLILFITGDRPMDEWDAFIEEYKAMGNYDEVISIYNSAKQNILDTSTNIPEYPW